MKIPSFSGLDRRQVLQLVAGSMLIPLIGCGEDTGDTTGDGGGGGSCSEIPEETAGPYPGDGSNGPDVLNASGIVRQDIRPSFGSLSGNAEGVKLTIELTIVEATSACAPLAGYAVYLWHCDREGRYSLYTAGATDQNYLRGVQAADASGKVTFVSTFPGCYAGRWPHIHFEVYSSLAEALSVANKVATSQLALTQESCAAVYATTGYQQSVTNLSRVSLSSDGVFNGNAAQQLATMSGNVTDGYTASLLLGI